MLRKSLFTLCVSMLCLPTAAQSLVINEVMVANIDMFLSPSTNFDGWIELYNPTKEAIDIKGFHLSDEPTVPGKWEYPQSGIVPSHGFLTIWFDHCEDIRTQVPFKLKASGGTIYLSDTNGRSIANATYPSSIPRTSYARMTDGGDAWGHTTQPTPGESNAVSAFASRQLPVPEVDSPSRLFSNGSHTIHVAIPDGTTLRYTTDGTTPTLEHGSSSPQGEFIVEESSCYRFRLFREGYLPSNVVTRTYIRTNQTFSVPVIAVSTDEKYLYDDYIGVMVKGKNGKSGRGQTSPCNWNMDWDRPVNFTLFAPDGDALCAQDTWLSVSGGWSRANEPHSFKLKANKVFGTKKKIDYEFFPQKPWLANRTLLLRNGGNDSQCRIKDAALQTIVQRSGIDLDVQSYVPVVHFLNGEYKGVINLREPSNKHYVYANYGWDDDEIDFMEMSGSNLPTVSCGSADALERWHTLAANAADAAVYEDIKELVDINEYINYMAVETFLGNNDWMSNNVKWFRHRANGRFRFITFDLDAALVPSDTFHKVATDNTSQNVLIDIFHLMLANEEFRKQFIDTYCLMHGSVFEYNRAVSVIDELAAVVNPMLALEGLSTEPTVGTIKQKLRKLDENMEANIRGFAPCGLADTEGYQTHLQCDTPDAQLTLNGLTIPYADFHGKLFPPAIIRAEAPEGYTFVEWRRTDHQDTYSLSPEITLPLSDIALTACFVPAADGISPALTTSKTGHPTGTYDLQGRKVARSTGNGITIVDGKKVARASSAAPQKP